MRRALLPLIIFAVTLPLAAQLPPGVTRIPYPVASSDSFFMAATAEDVLVVAPMLGRTALRVSPDGSKQELDLSPTWNFTYDAATGPDGAVWFGGFTGVSRVAADTIAPQAWLPTVATIVVPGPDGYMWLLANNSVVRMRSDGLIVSSFPGVTNPSGAAFGNDGALYVAATSTLVRISASGERTSIFAATRGRLFPGNGFFWSGSRSLQAPHHPATPGEITKLDYAGRTLATFNIGMTPFVSDATGNLWLRSATPEGDVLAQLSPSGVLTKFGPIAAPPHESQCFQRYFGGLAVLSDGRVAMADYFPDQPRSGIDPCFHVPRPAGQENAITIVDPRFAPVLSIEPLVPTQRRHASRH